MKIDTLILLAGGLATRLNSLTETIPKSMLDVSGKPFIERQFELLKNKGIQKAVICAGHLGEKIKEYVKEGKGFGIETEYSFDGDEPLGTGGAIQNALPLLSDDVFYVMYGDSYLNTDFEKINEYFLKNRVHGLMTVFRNESKWDRSNIEFSDGRILVYDKKNSNSKMEFIDYGLGILTKNAFDDFKDKKIFDLEEVYKNLLEKGQLSGFEVKERFYEIGSFEGLKETRKFFNE